MNTDIDDILDNFDFYKVKIVMDALNWKYHDSRDDTITIYELRKMARYLLNEVNKHEDSDTCFSACGGFTVERNMYPGDTKKYFTLKFVVEEESSNEY